MANFDLDDPLGDLLSDGSNDSFFEEPKTALAKRSSLTKTPEKKSVSELFGIEKSEIKSSDSKTNWLGLGDESKKTMEKPQIHSSPKKIEKKISFEDDNILDNLGLDTKPESKKDAGSRKQSLVESILKPPTSSSGIDDKNFTFDDILKGSKFSRKMEKTPAAPLKATKNPEELTVTAQAPFPMGTAGQREGRRPHPIQSGFTDILGILSSEPSKEPVKESRRSTPSSPMKKSELKTSVTKPNLSMTDSDTVQTEILFQAPANREIKTKSAPNISTLPNWLDGGSTTIESNKSEMTVTDHTESKSTVHQNKDPVVSETVLQADNPQTFKIDANSPIPDNFLLQSLINQQKLATQDMEYQHTTVAMQHQNSQLIMALQLKKYEENLANMQKKQQELLSKQEKQFNCLLERQFAKQQMMENNMRLQQERLNSHMQVLLSQTSMGDTSLENVEKIDELKKTTSDENVKLVENLLTSVKQRSQEEKFLLDESYKKQISTLEQTMESIENRLKSEIDYLHTSYLDKFEQLKQNHEEEVQKYKQKIEEMAVLQSNEIKSLRENHDKIIEEIKYEYNTLIENIKQTKQSETQLFQNSAEYSHKLDTNLQLLDTNSKLLIGVREKVNADYSILSVAREESLRAKEEEIKLMKESLEKVRASAEVERSQLLALVRALETKLTEQTQNAREERWTMQQAAATLAARSAALDRESEFNRASIEREREQLKTLKETLLAEQESKTLQLTEEKLAISAERSRLETSTKLLQNYDAQRARAEIDAAIEVAQKAAELTDIERKNLQRMQCDVETMKRSLLDREHKLAMKEKDLEMLTQIAEKKSKDGEQAIVQANATQRDYNERLKDIQNQLVSLTNREKRLAEEKIALSKERIGLQGQMRQLKHSNFRVFDASHLDDDFPESI
ncbi:fas-binding factor 1 [Holotrichia oblita]|uniref:Fas-binding factor 1 n=1 Tax=Holotrichia oblita TaxID=644536 RepID=A0ACB9TXM9_HOLOL|nr:fas-binding factor 1 [Holotrichia oblita]